MATAVVFIDQDQEYNIKCYRNKVACWVKRSWYHVHLLIASIYEP